MVFASSKSSDQSARMLMLVVDSKALIRSTRGQSNFEGTLTRSWA